ncbi:hypothetical protein V2W30_37720 [Streptomyces sp. Q6]|uniref:Uncharacterized protein n=1 Tax=Streptomyces citrinus TaxID=3118173 RepID=A0ACD5AML5_9ACTN
MSPTDSTPVHGYGATAVGVELSNCTPDDAASVFDVLGTAYPTDRDGGERPDPAATVWPATVQVAEATGEAARPAPTPLTAAVTADLQGGPQALTRLRATLDAAFRVEEVSTTSGDQEQVQHLRLTSASGHPA